MPMSTLVRGAACPPPHPNPSDGIGRRQLTTAHPWRGAAPAPPASTFAQARRSDAEPLSAASRYQDGAATSTWDQDVNFACVCDSSWSVGLGDGERQLSEWFGPDCSMLRCPSGNDPSTGGADETDCHGKTAAGSKGAGSAGNVCHVECSNRGVCDREVGICTCHTGYQGVACEIAAPRRGADSR